MEGNVRSLFEDNIAVFVWRQRGKPLGNLAGQADPYSIIKNKQIAGLFTQWPWRLNMKPAFVCYKRQ
jgi:hypothetical protein